LEGDNREGKKLLGDGQILKPDFIGLFAADWRLEWMTAFGCGSSQSLPFDTGLEFVTVLFKIPLRAFV